MRTPPGPPTLAPSLLSADFSRLGTELAAVAKAGAGLIHVDVMDGRFVPNLTVGLPVVASLKKATPLPLDCHLMIVEPGRYAVEFVKAGAAWVSVHQEADPHLHRTLAEIRGAGAMAGVALNPSTPVEVLSDVLEDLDFVLVMSVNPGFGGQRFIPGALRKIRELDRLRREGGHAYLIQVDGGVGPGNAGEIIQAGADCLVAGNAIFGAADPGAACRELLARMTSARTPGQT
ncbi:MAG: ribulose-phosphate 3-epimerase [Acidobacteria bacterium]|nr:ribulose-phosphate 3-epimerase [Acidobacteriota bacterium]